MNLPSGKRASTRFRLFSAARLTMMWSPLPGRRGLGHRNGQPAGEVLAGQRVVARHDVFNRAGAHHLPAVLAGARTHVHDPVGGAHRVLVVLHDQHGIAEVTQVEQCAQQTGVVALVQADAGLVQDVHHAHQLRADLRRQANALRFAAAEAGGLPIQGQVVETDVVQEAQPRPQLLQDLAGDRLLAVAQRRRRQSRRAAVQRIAGLVPFFVGLQHGHPKQRVGDRLGGDFDDVLVGDGHPQRFGPQTPALAGRAGPRRHEALVLLAHVVAGGFFVPPLHAWDHALVHRLVAASVAGLIDIIKRDLFALRRAVEDDLLLALAELAERHAVEGNAVLGAHAVEQLLVVAILLLGHRSPAGRQHCAALQAFFEIDRQLGIELHLRAQAGAGRAGAVRAVEAKGARLDLRQADAALNAGETLAEETVLGLIRIGYVADHQHAIAQAQRGLDRVGEPRRIQSGLRIAVDHQAIYHRFDGMHLVAVKLDIVVDLVHLAVDAHTHKAGLAHILEDLLVFAFARVDQRRHQQQPSAVGQCQQGIDDLLHGLLANRRAAVGAVGEADAREEQAQIVVDLGDRAHGRARVAAGALLVDRNGRAETLDLVHVRLFHQSQKLAGVGRKRFDITTLTFGVDGVKGQAGLARSRQAGENHHFVARDFQVDILEVMFACAANDQLVLCHRFGFLLLIRGFIGGMKF